VTIEQEGMYMSIYFFLS